ncbi:MAG: 4'-phosphopantetheinyl transferase superfamily protein [Planctomycetes bacterium]|nr:4'-phosphopantetheinyl transferase superfamily protein [Planctomycetota bacterium]
MTLHPVLVPVPDEFPLRSPQRVAQQRRAARHALEVCAGLCGAGPGDWPCTPDGVPLPKSGWHWSLSHKRRWAAAVIAEQPVGIDIEEVLPRDERLYEAVGDAAEWAILGSRSMDAFYRLWTAKEAVLKACGVGLAGLDRCRIVDVPSAREVVVVLAARHWTVTHIEHDGHVASVTSAAAPVRWHPVNSVPPAP